MEVGCAEVRAGAQNAPLELFEGLSVLVVAVYNTHLNFTVVQTQTSVRAARPSSTPSNPLMKLVINWVGRYEDSRLGPR